MAVGAPQGLADALYPDFPTSITALLLYPVVLIGRAARPFVLPLMPYILGSLLVIVSLVVLCNAYTLLKELVGWFRSPAARRILSPKKLLKLVRRSPRRAQSSRFCAMTQLLPVAQPLPPCASDEGTVDWMAVVEAGGDILTPSETLSLGSGAAWRNDGPSTFIEIHEPDDTMLPGVLPIEPLEESILLESL